MEKQVGQRVACYNSIMFNVTHNWTELASYVLAAIFLLAAGFFIWANAHADSAPFISSELGIATYSPNGEGGGALMPASGCSQSEGGCPTTTSYECSVNVSPAAEEAGTTFSVAVTDSVVTNTSVFAISPPPLTINSVRLCREIIEETEGVWPFVRTTTSYSDCTNLSNEANQTFDSTGFAVKEHYVLAETSRNGNTNECTATFNITRATPGKPDLAPNPPIASPDPVERGSELTLTTRVPNKGVIDAGPYNIVFHIDTDGDGASEYQRNVRESATTKSGKSRRERYTETIPSSVATGTWRVGYFVDTSSEVDESNEFNNWSGWTPVTVVDSTGTEPECDDGYDNDGDGFTDSDDPACDDDDDDDEDPQHCSDPSASNFRAVGSCDYVTECSDGLNNDGVQGIDMNDPDCTDPSDDSEDGVAGLADPTIEVVPDVIRQGNEFELIWDPAGNFNCELSDNVEDETGNKPDATVAGSITLSAERPTEFSINCDFGQEADVRIQVIPNIFET